jgi:heme/copper-type cytochrome/quinol oxidase subunit 3
LRGDILNNDLTLIYIGARIGLEHGWTHIYSLPLQHDLFTQMRPDAPFNDGERFLSPPPFAWLLLPLILVGAAGAVYVWIAGSVLALVAAWWIAAPGQGPVRVLWLLATLAWYPVLYSLSLAQPDLLLVLLMAAGWRLAEAKRPYLAGIVLGLSVIKPQLTIVLPLLLLVSGRWRIAAAWVVTAAALAAISLAVIGGQGLSDYRSLLNEAQGVTNNRYFTLAYVLGPGAASYIAQGVVIAIAVAGAYLNRRSTNARVFALGILATTIGATYWHLQDFTILVLAAWLFWRDHPPAWQRWWLLVVVLGGELAWPLSPLPVLIGVSVWFAFTVAPARVTSSKPAMATT